MRNQSVLFFTEKEALLHVINKQSCCDKMLMVFVRKLVSVCLDYNILFRAKHIPGTHNTLADYLSCLQVQTFKKLAPASMNSFLTDIPLQPQSWPSTQQVIQIYEEEENIQIRCRNETIEIIHSGLDEHSTMQSSLIAYLLEHNYTHSTMNTYISALSYSHRLPDPTRVLHNSNAQRLWQHWLIIYPLGHEIT